MTLEQKLDRIVLRAEELRAMLAAGVDGERFVAASRELAEIEPVEQQILLLRAAERARDEAEAARADPELRELADAELDSLRETPPLSNLRRAKTARPVISAMPSRRPPSSVSA